MVAMLGGLYYCRLTEIHILLISTPRFFLSLLPNDKFYFFRSYFWILCLVCPPEPCHGCPPINWKNFEALSPCQELEMYPKVC